MATPTMAIEVQPISGSLDRSTENRYNLFVEKYTTNGFDARKAAIDSGYAASSALTLLKNKAVQKKLDWEFRRRREKYLVTEERIMEELASMAFLDIGELYHGDGTLKRLDEMPERARRAIGAMDVSEIMGEEGAVLGFNKKIKTESKIKSLELLGKTFKMFVDKVEHDVGGGLADMLIEARRRRVKEVNKAPQGLQEVCDSEDSNSTTLPPGGQGSGGPGEPLLLFDDEDSLFGGIDDTVEEGDLF